MAGYDRIPLLSATGVFTLDTATEVFSLHSAKVPYLLKYNPLGIIFLAL